MENNYTPCCPKFNPSLYDGREFNWQQKTFIKDEVMAFMHMPLNLHKVMVRMWKKIKNAHAEPADQEFLMLCYDPSLWKTEVYITTTKIVPNANNVAISGTFMAKVFDGAYKDIPKFYKEMEVYVASKGRSVSKMYIHYTYCPKCAEYYRHNYMIFFAETQETVVV